MTRTHSSTRNITEFVPLPMKYVNAIPMLKRKLAGNWFMDAANAIDERNTIDLLTENVNIGL